jgi:hypothetical protein
MSATLTSEGYIPHLQVVTDIGTLLAPVKLQPDEAGKLRIAASGFGAARYPGPMRRDGRLVFALPGGGEVLA